MKFIYDNFDLLFDKAGSVDAFKKLILEMAVRGKLVPQDPNDEPASFLIEKIFKEKEKLIQEGELKKEKPLPPIKEDEILFELPGGWEWIRLGEVVIFNPRNKLEDDLEVSFIPMKLIEQGFTNKHSYEVKIWKDIKNGFTHFTENDVVLAKITPCFENRKSAIMTNLKNAFGAGTTELHVMRTIENLLDPEYLLIVVKTQRFLDEGVRSYTGTAGQQRISRAFCMNYNMPLPPLNEQKRIVQKIDEIFEMIPKFQEALEQRVNYKRQLNQTSLNTLTNTSSREEFIKSVQFVVSNFDSLYDTTGNIKELRQAILTLAVQGKLLPQDPNDEPASILLEKIQKEKEQLIKEGVLKKEKPLSPIKEGEIPYVLPKSWKWVRLKEICYNFGQKIPRNIFTYIDVGSIDQKNGTIKETLSLIKPEDAPSRARKIVNTGTLIYSTVRPYLLNIAIVDKKFVYEPIASTAFAVMNPFNEVEVRYLYYYLRSNIFTSYVSTQMVGMAYPAINDANLFKGYFPLPPFNEQMRIVEKIDMLLALCGDLENRIADCNGFSEQLVDTVIHEVVADVS